MAKILEIMPLAGSAMTFIGDQLSYMAEHGNHEMHLICTPGKGIEEFVQREGARYFALDIPRAIKPWQDLKNIWKVLRYVRKNKIDIVIGHQSKGVLYGMIAGKLGGARRRVVLAHGVLEDTMTGLKQKIFSFENRLMTMCATQVLCVSPSVMRRRCALGIDKPQKQHLLGKGSCNGVDALEKFNPDKVPASVTQAIREQYGLSAQDFVIGFCGRLVRDKGIIELVDAIKLLTEKHPEKSLKLFVIGQPEKRDAIPEDTLNFLNTSKNVVFTGRVDYSEIQNYYSVMNAFILPSYREGFPTVVLEASAMELPVIASRATGCIDSIIENETGVYCDIEPTSIADAIETLFDQEKAQRYGQAGREFVLKHFEHRHIRELMFQFITTINPQ